MREYCTTKLAFNNKWKCTYALQFLLAYLKKLHPWQICGKQDHFGDKKLQMVVLWKLKFFLVLCEHLTNLVKNACA